MKTSQPLSWFDYFGELRSLIETRDITQRATQVRICHWVETCSTQYKNEFQSQALPYLEHAFTHTPEQPYVVRVESFKSLKRLHNLLPCVFFELGTEGVTLAKLKAPEMERVVSLDFSSKKWLHQGNQLFHDSTALKSLHTLKLRSARVYSRNFDLFLQAPAFTQLHTLDLGYNNEVCGEDLLKGIAAHARPGQLRYLSTPKAYTMEDVQILSTHEAFSGLRTLHVQDHPRSTLHTLLGPGSTLKSVQALTISNLDLGVDTPLADDRVHTLHPIQSLSIINGRDHCLTLSEVKRLAHSRYLACLTRLRLYWSFSEPHVMEELCKSTHLSQLKELELSSCGHLDTDDMKRFASAQSFDELETLNMERCALSFQAIEALAQSAHLPNLTALHLGHSELGDEHIQALAKNTSWARLAILDLKYNALTDAALVALSQNTSWRHLRHLNLSQGTFGDEGLTALFASPLMTHVHTLNMTPTVDACLSSKTIEALVHSPYLKNLRVLTLERSIIGNRGATLLATAPSLGALEHLYLDDCKIGDEGGAALLSSCSLANLMTLSLKNNDVGEQSAKAMSNTNSLPRLTYLDLSSNAKLGNCVSYIARAERLNVLLELKVNYIFEKEEVRVLKKAARHRVYAS